MLAVLQAERCDGVPVDGVEQEAVVVVVELCCVVCGVARKWTVSGLQEARAAVPVAQVQTGETSSRRSSDTCWTVSSCSTSSSTLQVVDRAEHLGSGLLQRGLKVGTDTFVGIFAQNRPEVRSRPSESSWLR